ncbi:MAG: phosphotransferase family protein [Fimbriimonadaceae bacterium]
MQPLASSDVEMALETLRKQFPDLEIRTLALTPQGMDNLTVAVNDELIFRLPHPGAASHAKELWALRELRGRTNLPIPNPERVGGQGVCTGYRMLHGERVEPHLESATADEKAGWVAQLADLMAEIHTTLTVGEARRHGVEEDRPAFSAIHEGHPVQAEYLKMAERMLKRHQAFEAPMRVIHNDMHAQNVLFDPTTRQLTGVIDFGDVSIAEPAIDLAYLLEIDITASAAIAALYEQSTGLTVDPERILDIYFLSNLNGLAEDEIPEPWFVNNTRRAYDYLRARSNGS